MHARAVELIEFDSNHGAALITGYQGADEAPLSGRVGDSGDDLVVEMLGSHRARHKWVGAKSFFSDLIDKRVGRPQRTHTTTRNAGQECDSLSDVIQPFQTGSAPYLALASLNHNGQAIRSL
ncbi:hypothetical protein D3C85_1312700 [compost metagenome]